MNAEFRELQRGLPPSWATCWGDSVQGPWAGFMVQDYMVAMRWCPPGTFMMGSPEEEVGRHNHETRHQVTLTRGFWMAEIPCTQAVYEAVMGANPARFSDPHRPVEQVSWHDAQAFLQKMNEQRPSLDLRLPTEAEWEYACRAGTSKATYAGNLEIVGERDAPVLDEIAWYGGNSGLDYDLEEAHDTSEWSETQYPTSRAGTRRTGTRRANPWGLKDMLGNVWEWCQDYGAPLGANPVVDPRGPIEGSDRVFRGGSWDNRAQLVRAACRFWNVPSYRDDVLGFRFVRGPSAPGKGEPR